MQAMNENLIPREISDNFVFPLRCNEDGKGLAYFGYCRKLLANRRGVGSKVVGQRSCSKVLDELSLLTICPEKDLNHLERSIVKLIHLSCRVRR